MNLVSVPVEQVRVDDRVHVSRKIGCRRIVDIREYDTLGLEQVDCFVILYAAHGPSIAWENRAGAKGVVTFVRRDVVALRPLRRGEPVQIERLHLVEEAG